MRVLICPDKFAGTLSASAAAREIARGWASAAPDDVLVQIPLADGGPGFLDVISQAVAATRVEVRTCDPLGRAVSGHVLLAADTAYVESAQACGLHLLGPAERDPGRATSWGLGTLIAAALDSGARRIVVGLGGSATNDGGAGMLAALGATPVDASGDPLPPGGAALRDCRGLAGVPRLRGATLVAATDVDNPLLGLHGASAVFGPQKGADRQDVLLLDRALERFAAVLRESLPQCPPDLAELAGAGAAGGIGAALYALGAARESGIGLVRRLTGLDRAMDHVDLVITGEGSFDAQSLHGKVVAGVARAALDRAVPCLVIAGQARVGRREAATAGICGVYTVADHVGSLERALSQPEVSLRSLAARVARQWSHRSR